MSIHPSDFCHTLSQWEYYSEYWLLSIIIFAFPTLFFISAPYGRFATKISWVIPPKIGWCLMEAPAPLLMLWYAFRGGIAHLYTLEHLLTTRWVHMVEMSMVSSSSSSPSSPLSSPPTILHGDLPIMPLDVIISRIHDYCTMIQWVGIMMMVCYVGHYIYRTCIFPLWLRTPHPMDCIPVACAFIFSMANATIQAYSAFCPFQDEMEQLSMGVSTTITPHHPLYHIMTLPTQQSWWLYLLLTMRLPLLCGVITFTIALMLNMASDRILITLRKSSHDRQYYIPYGLLFRYVSCPNYLCETIEWVSLWILSGGRYGPFLFACATIANLFPRAMAYHRNYHERFGDQYPANRKAIIPGLL